LVLGFVFVQIITSYFFGIKAQKELELQFKKMTQSPYVVVDNYDYQKGFFTSNLTVKLSLNSQIVETLLEIMPEINNESQLSKAKYSVTYTTHITHGIFAGLLNGYFKPIAQARTHAVYFRKCMVLWK
jgi:uncharacterized protein YdgA (DUF945 family)